MSQNQQYFELEKEMSGNEILTMLEIQNHKVFDSFDEVQDLYIDLAIAQPYYSDVEGILSRYDRTVSFYRNDDGSTNVFVVQFCFDSEGGSWVYDSSYNMDNGWIRSTRVIYSL